MASPSQILANQHNAALSTGPRTAAGKASSSLNSLKHGAYSTTDLKLVLSPEVQAAFDQLLAELTRDHKPATQREHDCVYDLARNRIFLLQADREESQYLLHLTERLTRELKKEGLNPADHLAARLCEERATNRTLRSSERRQRHLRTNLNRALRTLQQFQQERRLEAAQAEKQRKEERFNQALHQVSSRQAEIMATVFGDGFVPATAEIDPPAKR